MFNGFWFGFWKQVILWSTTSLQSWWRLILTSPSSLLSIGQAAEETLLRIYKFTSKLNRSSLWKERPFHKTHQGKLFIIKFFRCSSPNSLIESVITLSPAIFPSPAMFFIVEHWSYSASVSPTGLKYRSYKLSKIIVLSYFWKNVYTHSETSII